MARIEKTVEINASPEKLWFAVFWNNVPQYLEEIKKAEYKTEPGLGAIAHVWSEVAGQKEEGDFETTEWAVNRKHAWRSIGNGSMTAVGSMTYTPIEGGTRATFLMDYELPYSFLGKLIDKLRVSKEMDRGIDRAMNYLKEIAEK